MTSQTFQRIVALVTSGNYVFSRHAFKEATEDGLLAQDLIEGILSGEAIEDYPDYYAEPCCLVFQLDPRGKPLHALWGLRKGTDEPAVLITCYRTGFRMPAMAGPSTRAGRRPESVEARNRGFEARRWQQLVSRLWGLYESADGDERPDCWGERIV